MFRGAADHAGDLSDRPTPRVEVAWRFELGERIDASAAIAESGVVYVAGRRGSVVGLDLGSGRVAVRGRVVGGVWSSPALWRGWLLAATDRRRLVALDLESLAVRWTLPLPSGSVSGLSVAGDALYLCSGDALIAVDLRRAREAWRRELDGRCFTAPALGGGSIVAATRGGSVIAADLAGAIRWRATTTAGADNDSSPVIAGDRVLAGSNDRALYAFDLATGARLWRAAAGAWVVATPAVAGDVVYAGDDSGALRALDLATGAERWRRRAGGDLASSPLVVGDLVLHGAHDSAIHAVDRATGQLRRSIDAGAPMFASFAYAGGTLVIATQAGSVIAVR